MFSMVEEQCQRMDALTDDCRRRMVKAKGTGRSKVALLDGSDYVARAARFDVWAHAALRYENSPQMGNPPF